MESNNLTPGKVCIEVVTNLFAFKNPLNPIKEYFGGPLKFQLKTSLILMPVDLFTDVFTGISYFWNRQWLEGILTYAIILGTGIGLSIRFLRHATWGPFIRSNTGTVGKFWKYILVFPPGLFPFVCARMYLTFLNDKTKEDDDDEKREERNKKLHDLFLKANCYEAIFEGKWESLLQLQATLHIDVARTTAWGFLDYVPIVHFVKEMYSLTSGLYDLTSHHFKESVGKKDPTPIMSRLHGIFYTAISILVPVVGVLAARRIATGECVPYSFRLVGPVFDETFAVIAFILLYYIAVAVFYPLSLVIAKFGNMNAALTFHIGVTGLYAIVGAFWFVVSDSSTLNCCVIVALIFFSVAQVVACVAAREFAEFSALMMRNHSEEFMEKRKKRLKETF